MTYFESAVQTGAWLLPPGVTSGVKLFVLKSWIQISSVVPRLWIAARVPSGEIVDAHIVTIR